MRPSPIRNLFLVIPLAVFAVACSKPTPPAAATAPAAGPQSEEDKTLYALGVVLSRNLQDCNYCFGCVGLSKKDFHILNVPFPRTEYFKQVKRLREALGV